MALSPGTQLGRYEIVGHIGAGGMGEVYKARDTRLERTVAIKVCPEQFSERFEREARAIAQLNHPHICQVYDVGPNYLVMEYIEGSPLQGPLTLDRTLVYAAQICGALEAAHQKGIVHRDLKPANILVTNAGVKLLDFGLAQLGPSSISPEDTTRSFGLTQAGTILGTVSYMSPEQAEAKPVDARTDIFAFGAVLYEMLSGRRAFDGDTSIAIMGAILHKDPEPIDAPQDLWNIIARCLQKAAEQRFQSAEELRLALNSLSALKSSTQQASIAVLPFANMSRDPDDEYFSDGLAEDIINALVKIPGLKVIARTSAFAFKGQNTDIRKIAQMLGVANVLEGSVRRAGNRIRVTAQLITASDGSHLWAERYDRQLEDLFALQDEIAAAIASELEIKFAPASAGPRRQPNLQAYEAYLRYRQYQWAFTPEGLQRSRECLEQAITIDPEFALPYTGLADHYFASSVLGNAAELLPRARSLAERALDLDPDLPEARGMLGALAGVLKRDWNEAECWFRLAVSRDVVPWHVRIWYAMYYLFPLGRLEEARREAERALEDNPLSQVLYHDMAELLDGAGLKAEARAAFEKSVELDPQFWVGFYGLALHYAVDGAREKARRAAEQAYAISPHNPYTIGALAGLRDAEDRAQSETVLGQLPTGSPEASVGLASFHFVRKDFGPAVDYLAKGIDGGYPVLAIWVAFPYARFLRDAAGWPALMTKFNLPASR
jgi:TolB-like protein/predicted Ser/Thr protein kinase